jgi:hypothetical protein
MSPPPNDNKQRALAREWAAARIVIIGGFIIAIAVAGYFWYRERQATLAEQQASMPHAVAAPHKIDAKTLARIELAVCTVELNDAKSLGIIPQYGALASPRMARGNAPRRFICEAQTHLTRYFIAADILCNHLADARCVSVYRIATKAGSLVYSRPQ